MNWNTKTHGRGFLDRMDAGQQLGRRLKKYERHAGALVLGLTPGGMAVANEVAAVLYLPMRPLLVRKIGAPKKPDAALGVAISGGLRFLLPESMRSAGITAPEIEAEARRQTAELENQERRILGDAPPLRLQGRVLIAVDEGLESAFLVPAVIQALRLAHPARIVFATPVAESAALAAVRQAADEAFDLMAPEDFAAVGEWYSHFPPVGDEEIRILMEKAARREAGEDEYEGKDEDEDGVTAA